MDCNSIAGPATSAGLADNSTVGRISNSAAAASVVKPIAAERVYRVATNSTAKPVAVGSVTKPVAVGSIAKPVAAGTNASIDSVVKSVAAPIADNAAANIIAVDLDNPDPANYENERGNILIILNFSLSIYLSYYFHTFYVFISFHILSLVRRSRGTAAGARRQQERFMRFLYQLSSAHYNWGRRARPRR